MEANRSNIFSYLRHICFAFFFTGCWLPANATHIVGGEMTYTCLGDDLYEIQLVVYRDCFFGNPNAYFDDPASIGVFDQNNALIQDIRVDLMGDDTLAQVLTDECLVVPLSVCVHTTTYRVIAELPPIIGGYQLAYQRCCRNQTIANIVEPLATGATFGVVITETALLECNSSAKFLQWPPLYICANQPIYFDQSATDVDGDSIAYRLCTPLQGADPDIPRPQPPNDPPFSEVVWNSPIYGVNNMLNGVPGGQALEIDPLSGLLTGVPNTIGQFVVGICAEEYRDGKLISTTRRDFQYNVGVCGQVTSAFFAPEIQCDGLEVTFENQSLGADNYTWYFGGVEAPIGMSTVPDPSYVFPDTGLYEVVLVAEPNEFCADTFRQYLQLLPNSLLPSFLVDTIACGDSLVLQLTDVTVDTLSIPLSWNWTVNGQVFSDQPNPLLILDEIGEYEIQLEVIAENGCSSNAILNVDASLFINGNLPNDTLLICPGDSVFLNTSFNESYEYQWSPTEFLNDPFSPIPLAFPAVSTNYQLLITDPVYGCLAQRSVYLEVSEPLVLDISDNIITCEDSILLEANSNNGVRYFWATDVEFTTNVVQGSSLWVNPIGEQSYYIQAINAAGCNVVDSILVDSRAVNVAPVVRDTAICLGEQLVLSLEQLDPSDLLTIQWAPEEYLVNGQNTEMVSFEFPNSAEYIVSYQLSNQYECQIIDSIRVFVVDSVQSEALISFQQCAGKRIQFSSDHPFAALYKWHFNDPFTPEAQAVGANVSHTYTEEGTYEVSLTLPDYLNCWDTLSLPVVVLAESPIMIDFTWAYQSCADTALVVFSDATQTNGTNIIGWQWWLSNSLIGTSQTTELVVYADSLQILELITLADNGCMDTIRQELDIPLIPFALEDSLQVCPNTGAYLYPQANPNYDYQWFPSTYLDNPLLPNPFALPDNDIIYTVQINDPNSICMRNGEIRVSAPPIIIYDISPDLLTCESSSTLFAASDQSLSFEWTLDQNFSNILNEESEWLTDLVGEQVFYVRMSDEFGCAVVDSVLLNSQAIQLFIDPEQSICIDDTLRLEAVVLGEEDIVFEWSPVAEIIGPVDAAVIHVNPSENTEYSLSVSNSFGCQLDTTVQVNIFNFSPPLSIIPAVDTLLEGESIQLIATDRPGYIYQWSPSIGLSELDVFNPVVSPTETTLYQVMISDSNGCTNSATVLLVVLNSACERPYIFVPNAFTPNGDQLNDDWGVEANVVESLHLQVYDRWGKMVFESFSQEDKWDGTFDEKRLPPDVYGYYLEVNCLGGEQYLEKGNVSLIR